MQFKFELILNINYEKQLVFLDAIASLYLIMSVTVTVTSLPQNITKKTFITFIAAL